MTPPGIKKILIGALAAFVLLYILSTYTQLKLLLYTPDYDRHSVAEAASPPFRPEQKLWVHRVNDVQELRKNLSEYAGLEVDITFSSSDSIFYLRHDKNDTGSQRLRKFLRRIQNSGKSPYIWLDFKNPVMEERETVFHLLEEMDRKYNLKNRVILEAKKPQWLRKFTRAGYYTSFYLPPDMPGPGQIEDDSLHKLVDRFDRLLGDSAVCAVSAPYHQWKFMRQVFPDHRILVWHLHGSHPVSKILRRKILRDERVDVLLVPAGHSVGE